MGRMLRVDDHEVRIVEKKEYCGVDLAALTLSQLEELQFRIENEVERRTQTSSGKVEIDWCGEWNGDLNTKKPYLAVLVPEVGGEEWGKNPDVTIYHWAKPRVYSYKFLTLVREKSDPLKFYFWGYLKVGLVLKGRIFIGQDYFYKVTRDGLKTISEVEAIKLILRKKSEGKTEVKEEDKV